MTSPPMRSDDELGRREREDTCEFARYDREGGVLFECDRTDFEIVPMHDEDDVRLCPAHRSWAVAMGES